MVDMATLEKFLIVWRGLFACFDWSRIEFIDFTNIKLLFINISSQVEGFWGFGEIGRAHV